MSPVTSREDGWEISIDRDDTSGNSHLHAVRRDQSGLCATIDCDETRHRRAAEVEVDIMLPNGMHMGERRYFHEGREGMTVVFKEAAYVYKLIREMSTTIEDYIRRKLLGQYPKTT